MKKNKIMKCYRFNAFMCEELKKIIEEIKINETSFVEMAIIEKISRIRHESMKDDKIIVQD